MASMKMDNLHISRCAGFLWHCAEMSRLLNFLFPKLSSILFLFHCMQAICLSYPPAISASSKRLAHHKGVSCSKAESRIEQVGERGRESRRPLQAEGNTGFVRPEQIKLGVFRPKPNLVYWWKQTAILLLKPQLAIIEYLLNYTLPSLYHFRCLSSPDINQWLMPDPTQTIRCADW